MFGNLSSNLLDKYHGWDYDNAMDFDKWKEKQEQARCTEQVYARVTGGVYAGVSEFANTHFNGNVSAVVRYALDLLLEVDGDNSADGKAT